jgi:C_GCAxxG_C_C family probable redox protein
MFFIENLDRDELERRIKAIHEKYVKAELNCSERTFLTVHGVLETDIPSEAVALMSGFGGGVGGIRVSLCGAVSGGIAALGLIYGRRRPPEGDKERAYDASNDFYFRFKRKFGSTLCHELIGDLLRDNKYDSEERRERCFQYTLNGVKLCIETLSKYR